MTRSISESPSLTSTFSCTSTATPFMSASASATESASASESSSPSGSSTSSMTAQVSPTATSPASSSPLPVDIPIPISVAGTYAFALYSGCTGRVQKKVRKPKLKHSVDLAMHNSLSTWVCVSFTVPRKPGPKPQITRSAPSPLYRGPAGLGKRSCQFGPSARGGQQSVGLV